MNEHQLLLELWSRIKSHIQPKERLEVADIIMLVFDEFGYIDDALLDEELDKELRAAAKSLMSDVNFDGEDDDEFFSE